MDCLPFPDYLPLISLSQRTPIVNKQKQISSFIETPILLRHIVMAIYRFLKWTVEQNYKSNLLQLGTSESFTCLKDSPSPEIMCFNQNIELVTDMKYRFPYNL